MSTKMNNIEIFERWFQNNAGKYWILERNGYKDDDPRSEAEIKMTKYSIQGTTLLIHLINPATLTIENPTGFEEHPSGVLIIPSADEITDSWYTFGHEASPKYLHFERFKVIGDRVEYTKS